MKKFFSKTILALFLIALVLRAGLFLINFSHNDFSIEATTYGDDGYLEIALNIINRNGFAFETEPPYTPNPLRPPLYPLLLAGLLSAPGSYWLAAILQILVACLIPVFSYLIARYFVSEKISFWVGLAMALEPLSMLFSFLFVTETFFIALFLLSILLFLKFLEKPDLKIMFWLSISFGAALMIKPTTQYIAFILPLVVIYFLRKHRKFSWKKSLRPAVLFVFIILLFAMPWFYRNYKQFGVPGMTAQPAFNVATYLVPSVLSFENDTNYRHERDLLYASGLKSTDINLGNSSKYIGDAIPVILAHPMGLVQSIGTSAITFFTHDGMLMVLQYTGIRPSNYLEKPALVLLLNNPMEFLHEMWGLAKSPMALVLFGRILWILITLFFIFGTAVYLKRFGFKLPVVLLLLLVLYFMATTCVNGLGVNGRFRMPINPILFMFAFYGISVLYKKLCRCKKINYDA